MKRLLHRECTRDNCIRGEGPADVLPEGNPDEESPKLRPLGDRFTMLHGEYVARVSMVPGENLIFGLPCWMKDDEHLHVDPSHRYGILLFCVKKNASPTMRVIDVVKYALHSSASVTIASTWEFLSPAKDLKPLLYLHYRQRSPGG